MVTSGATFEIYDSNLDFLQKGALPPGQTDQGEEFSGVDYNNRATLLFLGTNRGKIYKWSI